MSKASSIYQSLRECVVKITVLDSAGEESVGTGFHLGEGYFATARHVVEGFERIELEHVTGFGMIDSIAVEHILLPESKLVDVAVLKTTIHFTDYYLNGYKSMPGHTLSDFRGIPFGALVDDAVSDDHILDEVILMGFPPVPLSDRPELVAVRGEVNATVRSYLAPDYYFHVISTVARGGFSGGPVIDEHGLLLGVFCQSFLTNDQQLETGFSAVLSIEALLRLLKDNDIRLPNNRNILIDEDARDYDAWYASLKLR